MSSFMPGMVDVEAIIHTAVGEVQTAKDTASLREVELKYLGKSGEISGLLKLIGSLPADEKPGFGQKVNQARQRVQQAVDGRNEALKGGELRAQFGREAIDVTLPGYPPRMGHEHVLSMTARKVKRVLGGLGFEYRESPELELFKYNFAALNYPPDHPAMDEQDTFYVDDESLMRTQTTDLQGHVYEEVKPPLRMFTIGRCFRNDSVDRTHHHTFHQVDAFMVDEGVSMADLKGTLAFFTRAMFGPEVKVRFRPDFFPFVEPGVDYAISTPKFACGKWLELGGAGLVHPNILEVYGIDSKRYSGFAFGLGIERIPLMAHGVDDLRLFLDNDLRFLEQFHETL